MKKIIILGAIIVVCLITGVYAFDGFKVNIGESKIGQPENIEGKLVYEIVSIDQEKMIIELINQSDVDSILNYTSTQRFDFFLFKNGKSMYTWSADKSFLRVDTQKVLKPKVSEKYIIDLKDLPVEPGEYEMEFFSIAKELENKPVLKGKLTIE